MGFAGSWGQGLTVSHLSHVSVVKGVNGQERKPGAESLPLSAECCGLRFRAWGGGGVLRDLGLELAKLASTLSQEMAPSCQELAGPSRSHRSSRPLAMQTAYAG